MAHCQRALACTCHDSLEYHSSLSGLPTPHSRAFELPGDMLHYAPDRPADVQHVKLVIALDMEQETIQGTAFTTFVALYDELKTISFDAIELQIEEVTLEDNTHLATTTTDTKLLVTLDRTYHYGETFTIAVKYHAKPRTGLTFIKPATEDPKRPEQIWTFGQPAYARYWFPCHDSPNDRATTEIIVTVPSRFITIANGNLLSVTDHGETKTHHWRHDVPHAAYLVSLVVSDFAVVEDQYKGKPVNYYVRKDRKDDAPLYMGKTPAMMQFFSDYTGVDYPYDKYAQTVVEIYTGAMEHTTCTTHSFSLLPDQKAGLDIVNDLVPVVAHELAHQWFGDLVTCRDWSNGWLNEGFATYFEHLWNEHDQGQDEAKYTFLQVMQGYLAEDAIYRRPIVYYVYHEQGFELFDRHLYNKGAWVLHMLRHQLGDAAFRRGLKTYLERFRTREVVTSDLERTLEEVTGRSLARFFQQWVYSGGHPDLNVSFAWDSEHRQAKVKIKQTQQTNELTPCFESPLTIAFTVPTSDEETPERATEIISRQVMLGEDGQVEQTFFFPLEREPLLVRIDPDSQLLKTLTFDRSTTMLCYQLAHDADVLGRIEAAEALGDRKEQKSFDALVTALQQDTFWGVRVTAASALAKHGHEQAQEVLIQTLQALDPAQHSRTRASLAKALGTFQAPQRQAAAERSAQVLSALLEQGDVSYIVEASAAVALGQTHLETSIDTLTKLLDRPSWTNTVQRSIFGGLGATGFDWVIDIMASYLHNPASHPTLRRAAIVGLQMVGQNKYRYSEQARQQAVTLLCDTLEHDSWDYNRRLCAVALTAFGEKRAISILERATNVELDDGVKRAMRVAAHTLRTADTGEEQLKQVRKDLEDIREENRRLSEQVKSLESRIK